METFLEVLSVPLSFVVIALIFSELRDGGGNPPPVPQDQKKPGLNRVNRI